MAIYPILETDSLTEKSIKAVLSQDFDGGYRQKRPKYTRKMKQFTLGYDYLTSEEAEDLEEFIMDNQGLSFFFIHPTTDDTYEVTYSGDELDIEYVTDELRKTQVVLREV